MRVAVAFVLLVVVGFAAATQQMILHPTQYDLMRQDISLDSTPKCQACRHVVTALRNHFVGATSLSPSSIVYEADPCVMAPVGVAGWCSDVYKKLLQCPVFIEKVFDRSHTVVKICESCGYDQFPLPPVRFCDNALYMPLAPTNDRCSECIELVKRVQIQGDPCDKLTADSCEELQTSLARCSSYNKYIHQPFASARRICEECAINLPDGTSPPGLMPTMYCDRPTPSPLMDNSICSMCVNVVHNTRFFPMDSPCRNMADEQCSYIQDRLIQCTVYDRMIDQHMYSALSICEECTDNKNPLAPQRFCTGQLRVGNSQTAFDPRDPERKTNNHPGVFQPPSSPFLKPEPPAPFPSPWWLKQQPTPGGDRASAKSGAEGAK